MFPTETLCHIISYSNDPELIRKVFSKEYHDQYIHDKLTDMIKKKKLIKPDDDIPYRTYYLPQVPLLNPKDWTDLLPDPCLNNGKDWTKIFTECEDLVRGTKFVDRSEDNNNFICHHLQCHDLRRVPAIRYADVSIWNKPSVCKNVFEYLRLDY